MLTVLTAPDSSLTILSLKSWPWPLIISYVGGISSEYPNPCCKTSILSTPATTFTLYVLLVASIWGILSTITSSPALRSCSSVVVILPKYKSFSNLEV